MEDEDQAINNVMLGCRLCVCVGEGVRGAASVVLSGDFRVEA